MDLTSFKTRLLAIVLATLASAATLTITGMLPLATVEGLA